MSATATTNRDRLVAAATSVPDLIARAQAVDPDLAAQLTGKALLSSRSPWGTLAVGVIAWAVSHFGLGWSDDVTTLVAGLGVLAGSFAMRCLTAAPIVSVLPPKAPAP